MFAHFISTNRPCHKVRVKVIVARECVSLVISKLVTVQVICILSQFMCSICCRDISLPVGIVCIVVKDSISLLSAFFLLYCTSLSCLLSSCLMIVELYFGSCWKNTNDLWYWMFFARWGVAVLNLLDRHYICLLCHSKSFHVQTS